MVVIDDWRGGAFNKNNVEAIYEIFLIGSE